MKFSFNLKNKEAKLEADVESLIEKGMDNKAKRPQRKTRYQIKQEEKRKNEELRQKHLVQGLLMMVAIIVFVLIICAIGASLNW